MNLKPMNWIYYQGRKHGVLSSDPVTKTVTIQRLNAAGEYIHSPFKVKGFLKPKVEPKAQLDKAFELKPVTQEQLDRIARRHANSGT